MIELSATVYLLVKALHIISVIAWMAALLYLPRLFVYHTQAEPGSDKSETFKVMEQRLMRVIMTPAMNLTWVFGIILLLSQGEAVWGEGWVYVKLACVLGLSALHGMMSGWLRQFAEDRNTRSEKFYRVANEVPAALMIVIVILVVMRPF